MIPKQPKTEQTQPWNSLNDPQNDQKQPKITLKRPETAWNSLNCPVTAKTTQNGFKMT